MCNTKEFKYWHKKECWRRTGILDEIEKNVNKAMHPDNLKCEIKIDGKWSPFLEEKD